MIDQAKRKVEQAESQVQDLSKNIQYVILTFSLS